MTNIRKRREWIRSDDLDGEQVAVLATAQLIQDQLECIPGDDIDQILSVLGVSTDDGFEATNGAWKFKKHKAGWDIAGIDNFKRWAGRLFPASNFDTLCWAGLLDDDGMLIDLPDHGEPLAKPAFTPRMTRDFAVIVHHLMTVDRWSSIAEIMAATGIGRSRTNNVITSAMKTGVIERSVLEPYRYRMVNGLDDRQAKVIARVRLAVGEIDETA